MILWDNGVLCGVLVWTGPTLIWKNNVYVNIYYLYRYQDYIWLYGTFYIIQNYSKHYSVYSICWHIFYNGSGKFRECLCEVRGERSEDLKREWTLEDWFIWGWCKYRGMEAHIPSVLGQHLLLCTSVVSCCVLGRDRKSVYLDVNIIYLLCVHIYSNISSYCVWIL